MEIVPSTQTPTVQKFPIRRPTAKRTFLEPSLGIHFTVPSEPTNHFHQPTKKGKSVASQDVEQNHAVSKGKRWKEHWIVNLIHVRGDMQDEFTKPPKQGVDIWHKVYVRLCAACSDFDKDVEACRKKWRTIYKEYKEDKLANKVSGNGRSNKCKYFDIVDEYMHDRAHVVCYAHASTIDVEEEIAMEPTQRHPPKTTMTSISKQLQATPTKMKFA
ncbi:hypothetical protein O6H91_07G012700 [Diphasiastrum complanatum]|uniref:Uncharacterized protein n=1 Tax=Diphasiastrum complanatum TaxID=34168 RepID=A0ACC2D2X4_DIPCM|nr:hypothetical protein O6H91_07G012700 [Diphasiastrum complanatum]